MNLYSPPSADLSENKKSDHPISWSSILIRRFGLLHGGLTLMLSIVTVTLLRQGLLRLASLNNEALLKTLASPDLYARSQKVAAALDLSMGSVSLAMVAVGFVLVTGLWRLRLWSRRLAIVQVVLLGFIVSLPAMGFHKRSPLIDILPFLTPVLVLGSLSLLLWLPSISIGFSPVAYRTPDSTLRRGKLNRPG